MTTAAGHTAENFITFIAKDKGKITVTLEFSDLEGNVLASGVRYVNVVDKPVQDLILNSSISTEQQQTVDLSWNDISGDIDNYSYKLYRRIQGEEWETRSIWNESEKVQVLNVYPYQPYLETWMTTTISNTESPAGMGLFDIDSVHIYTFNQNPASYLLDEDGSWKCDVIFFGTSDCNSGYDLNAVSADYVQKFIDSGRGVLFGHDTICGGSSQVLRHWYFNDFAEQLGLVVKTPRPEIWYRTTSVSVVNIGTLTNFPWVIRGTLTVPNTHSTGQYLLDATEWLTLNATKRVDEATCAIDNFYLATKGNLGMIQTGDSTGQATDDERKILANTLFYLYQISNQTTAKDNSFYDETAPDKPEAELGEPDNGTVTLSLSAKDNATKYEYYISAEPESDAGNSIVKSNVVSESAFADLNGFVVAVNDVAEPCPDIITYDETNEFVQNVQAADANGKLTTAVEIPDFGKQYYIHAFAVDNANNVSEEVIIPVGEAKVDTEITTDKDIYNPGETVKVSTLSSSVLFGITADVNLSIYDEYGNLTKELAVGTSQALSPDDKFTFDGEWTIPESYVGKYTAKILWTSGDRELAAAAYDFKIAANGELNNTVHTDKETYYSNEPVSIFNTIMNSSTNSGSEKLVLNVSVYNEESEIAASFSYDVGTLHPNSDCSYNDVIKPGELSEGKYTVCAEVSDESGVASEDTAEFSVVDTSAVIVGDIEITSDGDFSQKVDFSVTNPSGSDIENAIIRVNIYPADGESLMGTILKQSDIKAGETLEFSEPLDTKAYKLGEYIGILTVETASDMAELDYDSFNIDKEYVAPEPDSSSDDSKITSSSAAPEESESETDSSTAPQAAVSDVDSSAAPSGTGTPNTGSDSIIPIILWITTILSAAGLVVIRLMGVKENEE